jgi:hypothetical protein
MACTSSGRLRAKGGNVVNGDWGWGACLVLHFGQLLLVVVLLLPDLGLEPHPPLQHAVLLVFIIVRGSGVAGPVSDARHHTTHNTHNTHSSSISKLASSRWGKGNARRAWAAKSRTGARTVPCRREPSPPPPRPPPDGDVLRPRPRPTRTRTTAHAPPHTTHVRHTVSASRVVDGNGMAGGERRTDDEEDDEEEEAMKTTSASWRRRRAARRSASSSSSSSPPPWSSSRLVCRWAARRSRRSCCSSAVAGLPTTSHRPPPVVAPLLAGAEAAASFAADNGPGRPASSPSSLAHLGACHYNND